MHRINGRITAREVLLIGDKGEQHGVLATHQALAIADSKGLDLVEVSPNSNPPVCRLMDYGKFKYREQKKEADAKKNRTENTVKELRIRYSTDIGDLNTKLKHAREFLLEGDKVKFSMRFRGREIMHLDLGHQKIKQIVENLADIATVDEQSPMSGRQIYVVLAPAKDQKKKAPAAPQAKQASQPKK
jgi:translation initiation factor IF-3